MFRNQDIRSDIEQWHQHESPLMHPRVREYRRTRGLHQVVIQQQIKIQHARTPSLLPLASGTKFDFQQPSKQL